MSELDVSALCNENQLTLRLIEPGTSLKAITNDNYFNRSVLKTLR